MRSPHLRIAACALAAAMFAACAAAERPVNWQAVIQDQCDRINAAGRARSVTGIMAHLAPDYVQIDATGARTTRANFQIQAAQVLRHATRIELTSKVRSVRVLPVPRSRPSRVQAPRTVVAIVDHRSRIVYTDEARRTQRLQEATTERETWVQTPAGWRKKLSQTVASH